jgi:hypothetical protein
MQSNDVSAEAAAAAVGVTAPSPSGPRKLKKPKKRTKVWEKEFFGCEYHSYPWL